MFNDEPREDSPVTESQDEVVEEITETTEEQTNWEQEAKKWQAIAKRAEKTNAKRSEPTEDAVAVDISTRDVLYIAKADIPAEDLDDVLTYSKKMGVSVQEAHEFYKPILKERQEERVTASATETKSPRAGIRQQSGEDLLRKAERTNALPDTDEGLTAIFEARRARQFKNDHRK